MGANHEQRGTVGVGTCVRRGLHHELGERMAHPYLLVRSRIKVSWFPLNTKKNTLPIFGGGVVGYGSENVFMPRVARDEIRVRDVEASTRLRSVRG